MDLVTVMQGVRALVAAGAPTQWLRVLLAAAQPPAQMHWEGIIAFEDRLPTGDGRFAEEGAWTWNTPFPLTWKREGGDHEGAVTVGIVFDVERRDNGAIWGAGTFDVDSDEGREAARHVATGLTDGTSIEPDSLAGEIRVRVDDDTDAVEVEDLLDAERDEDGRVVVAEWRHDDAVEVVTEGRIRTLAMVTTPAWDEVGIHLADGVTLEALLAGDLPMVGGQADDTHPEPDAAANVTVNATFTTAEPCSCGASTTTDGPNHLTLTRPLTVSNESLMIPLHFEVTGDTDLPVADRDREWDGAAAARRVFDLCSDGDTVDPACVGRAFLWRDPDGDGTAQAHWSLGFADVVDGTLTIVPRGVAATAGGRGVDAADIPDADKDRVRARICALYDRVRAVHEDWPDCPFADDGDAEADVDALVAAGVLVVTEDEEPAAEGDGWRPPAEWFADPQFGDPDTDARLTRNPVTGTVACPPTIDLASGRFYGHTSPRADCHIGFPDRCETPPDSEPSLPYLLTGQTPTADGGTVRTTTVTMDTGHAPIFHGASRAAAHYDDTGTQAIDVAVGYDRYGMWMAGAVRPEVLADDKAMRRLLAAQISPDWRDFAGRLEPVALLAVNKSGYPIARAASAAVDVGGESEHDGPVACVRDGRVVALVASAPSEPFRVARDDIAELRDAVTGLQVAAIDRDLDGLRAEAAERIAGSLGR